MTVSTDHPVNAMRLAEHLKHLGVDGPFKLYFVVPMHLCQQYPVQKYKHDGEKNPLDRYKVEQWVLGIDLSPTLKDNSVADE